MGQGHHIKIVYGTTDVPEFAEDEEPWDDASIPLGERPETWYESRQRWCGFTVAANGGMAAAPELDLRHFAVPLEGLPAHLDREAASALANARRRWDAWREKFPQFGPGRLLFVAEYD